MPTAFTCLDFADSAGTARQRLIAPFIRTWYPATMHVTLTPRGEELLEAALARGLGRSPAEVLECALENITREEPVLTEKEKQHRREAVDAMLAFNEKYHLTL